MTLSEGSAKSQKGKIDDIEGTELVDLLKSRTVGTMPPKDSRDVQHIVDELNDDRKDVGRSSPTVCPLARLRLPGHLATAKWRHDAGVLGSPSPSHSEVFGPPLLCG